MPRASTHQSWPGSRAPPGLPTVHPLAPIGVLVLLPHRIGRLREVVRLGEELVVAGHDPPTNRLRDQISHCLVSILPPMGPTLVPSKTRAPREDGRHHRAPQSHPFVRGDRVAVLEVARLGPSVTPSGSQTTKSASLPDCDRALAVVETGESRRLEGHPSSQLRQPDLTLRRPGPRGGQPQLQRADPAPGLTEVAIVETLDLGRAPGSGRRRPCSGSRRSDHPTRRPGARRPESAGRI